MNGASVTACGFYLFAFGRRYRWRSVPTTLLGATLPWVRLRWAVVSSVLSPLSLSLFFDLRTDTATVPISRWPVLLLPPMLIIGHDPPKKSSLFFSLPFQQQHTLLYSDRMRLDSSNGTLSFQIEEDAVLMRGTLHSLTHLPGKQNTYIGKQTDRHIVRQTSKLPPQEACFSSSVAAVEFFSFPLHKQGQGCCCCCCCLVAQCSWYRSGNRMLDICSLSFSLSLSCLPLIIINRLTQICCCCRWPCSYCAFCRLFSALVVVVVSAAITVSHRSELLLLLLRPTRNARNAQASKSCCCSFAISPHSAISIARAKCKAVLVDRLNGGNPLAVIGEGEEEDGRMLFL